MDRFLARNRQKPVEGPGMPVADYRTGATGQDRRHDPGVFRLEIPMKVAQDIDPEMKATKASSPHHPLHPLRRQPGLKELSAIHNPVLTGRESCQTLVHRSVHGILTEFLSPCRLSIHGDVGQDHGPLGHAPPRRRA